MKKSLKLIISLLKDVKKARKLTFLEMCILNEATKGLKR